MQKLGFIERNDDLTGRLADTDIRNLGGREHRTVRRPCAGRPKR
jgi:hypothetical protein